MPPPILAATAQPEDIELQTSENSNKIIVDKNGKLRQVKPKSLRSWTSAILLLFAVPALIAAVKILPWAGAAEVSHIFSLTELPPHLLGHVQRLMLMPLGVVIVVAFRLGLGIRVLGPVRPILIAIAYQLTGFVVGTVFLLSIMILIALIRPLLRSAGMPYFGRIAIVLSLVSFMVLITMQMGVMLGVHKFLGVGLMPVVVLTFAAEGFAKTLYHEGVKSASWCALMTICIAALITLYAAIPGLYEFFRQFPELLLTQVGLVCVIVRFGSFKALEFLNPPIVVRRRKTIRSKSKKSKKSKKSRTPIKENGNDVQVLIDNKNQLS